MSDFVRAVFENGILRPHVPLALPDGSQVEITVRQVPESPSKHADALADLDHVCSQIVIPPEAHRMTREEMYQSRTNVLVYRVDSREPVKRAKAQAFIHQLAQGSSPPLLLWQGLVEFVNQMQAWRRKNFLSDAQFDRVVHDVRTGFDIVYPAPGVMDHTLRLVSRYQLSYFDALLVGACVDAGIDTLYTEDMGAPAQYDSVQLVNPFA